LRFDSSFHFQKIMTYPSRLAQTLALACMTTCIGAGVWLATGQPGQAETASALDPLKDFRTDTNSDPFSNRGDASSSMFNLIHRAMQGGMSVDQADVAASQRDNVNDATASFLAKQRQLIQKSTPNTQPGTTPAAAVIPAIALPGTVTPSTVMPDAPAAIPIVP
jgi:hypothetical protein